MVGIERKLKAVANKRRLAIIKFLDLRNEASVGEIAGHIKLSFKSTSRHLSVLAQADIVDKEQRSKSVYYRLYSSKSGLIKYLLSALKTHS
jgi:DNA-binding transcriptional ArsR family regulator